jgi:hypothetical protein
MGLVTKMTILFNVIKANIALGKPWTYDQAEVIAALQIIIL